MPKPSSVQKQEALQKAKESGKQISKGISEIAKGGVKAVLNTLKGGYHLIDAGDKAIGEQIEKKQQEKGKKIAGGVRRFVRNNLMKILLATSLVSYGGNEVSKYIQDNDKEKEELVLNAEENEGSSILEKEGKGAISLDETYSDKGIHLLRDGSLTFYIVQKGDCLSVIRQKLSQIPEFSYLSSPKYLVPAQGRNIQSFNTPPDALVPGFRLPIPLKVEDREIDITTFKKQAKTAINQMKDNGEYGEKIKQLLKNMDIDKIVNIMTAYARSETAQDRKEFSDPIGSVELHRWEPKFGAYSFSYFHILMEKTADKKGYGPGLKARTKLGFTEGDCYDVKKACQLFLGYCFEKKSDPTFFFKIDNLDEAKKVGRTYNGHSDYGEKLWANVQYIKKV